MDEVVELNVGGIYFTTTKSTLCKEPSSMLARMFAGDMTPSTKDKQGRYFIDRSGQHFGAVLSYLHGEKVDMLATRSLVEEAKYYQAGFVKSNYSLARKLDHICCSRLAFHLFDGSPVSRHICTRPALVSACTFLIENAK